MKTLRLALLRAMAAAGCYFSPVILLADTNEEPVATKPADLVRAALKSELDGPSEVRQNLLNRAIKTDPDFAPARWQSGWVHWGDEWLTLEQAARRASDDPRSTAYHKLRDGLVDTADDHLLRRRATDSRTRQPAFGRDSGSCAGLKPK